MKKIIFLILAVLFAGCSAVDPVQVQTTSEICFNIPVVIPNSTEGVDTIRINICRTVIATLDSGKVKLKIEE